MVRKSQPEYKFYRKCQDEQFHFINPQDDIMFSTLGKNLPSLSYHVIWKVNEMQLFVVTLAVKEVIDKLAIDRLLAVTG